MRQLTVRVPSGRGAEILDIACDHGGTSLSCIEAQDQSDKLDIVRIQVPNGRLEGLMEALDPVDDLHVTLLPRGIISLRPPADEAAEQALDVQPLSPIEVFLGGLQSIGSWTGFLGYAAAAGVVVWIGLFTEVVFLLTAAMLIAPFAGPAMNAALATARGDAHLFGRSLLRYFAALGVCITVAFLLSLIMQQEIASDLTVQSSVVASVAVLLPLVAGAAGALNLCQSERSSLVSGAATGMLVAASLAPPAGLVGMAMAIGEWGMMVSALFVLLLQIAGINLAGAVVFRAYGINSRGARYDRGRRWVSAAAWSASLVVLAGLLVWQFSDPPNLTRSTQAKRATADVRQAVQEANVGQLIQANAQFTRADIEGQNTLLVTIYVQGNSAQAKAIETRLVEKVKAKLQGYHATPLVDVTVLEP